MARYRLSEPAKADIAAILKISEQRHGRSARFRYRALLTAAIRRIASHPEGRSTVDRAELGPGIRSVHIRHSRDESREPPVMYPAHIVFYRVLQQGRIDIVRVLHERVEPGAHVGPIGDEANE